MVQLFSSSEKPMGALGFPRRVLPDETEKEPRGESWLVNAGLNHDRVHKFERQTKRGAEVSAEESQPPLLLVHCV